MKKYLILLLCYVIAAQAYSQQYGLNAAESEMSWTGKAAFSAYTLSGNIEPKSGVMACDGERIREAALIIDMKSIQSDIKQLEQHLRSADFFEVKRFPEARFTLLQPLLLEGGEEAAYGALSIKGITRQEKAPLRVSREAEKLVLEGKAVINRTDYGIYYNSPNFFENLKQDAIADDFELSFKLVFEEMEAK